MKFSEGRENEEIFGTGLCNGALFQCSSDSSHKHACCDDKDSKKTKSTMFRKARLLGCRRCKKEGFAAKRRAMNK